MTRTFLCAALLAAALSRETTPLSESTVLAAGLSAQTFNIPAQRASDDAGIRRLLLRVEQVVQRSDVSGYLALLSSAADRTLATTFAAAEFRLGTTRVVIQEREREDLRGTLAGSGYMLIVDAFIERGDTGRVATWALEIRRTDDEWLIADELELSTVENLYRLSLNPLKQFDASNFKITSEDLELTLATGSVFVVETDHGITGLVLAGAGQMNFHPAPETEKGQARIFAGADTVESRFDAAFVRLGTLDGHVDMAALTPRTVDSRDLRRAEQIFREESAKSFTVDLADLTPDTWSLTPGVEDFLAEVRTRRFDTLTYSRAASEPEDISFFERRRHRNIAVYPSKSKLASRGRFYNEDDLAPFDVIDYNLEVTSIPERAWIDGRAVMRIRVRAPSIGQLTIRLADSLVVRSIASNRFGRLFNLRVNNQNTILVNLPATMLQGSEMTLTIEYSGRLVPQSPEREALAPGQRDPQSPPMDNSLERPEPSFLYSNQAYWYPQSTVTDYATATMRITVPEAYTCVGSGEQLSGSPEMVTASEIPQARKTYTFEAERPVRYLAFLVSRLVRADRWTVMFDGSSRTDGATPAVRSTAAPDVMRAAPPNASTPYAKLDLIVEANPRQLYRGKDVAERAVDVVQFYESILGDSPYKAFTVALIENSLPGGHSPGFFAQLSEPLSTSGITWRFDPATFVNFPEFFLAHETAHQWWGQAVGWRNYHEQWLSEGFAQYFAALYAQKFRGDEVFTDVLRQMRKWALDESDQGPVYLGYRVGHIKNDGKAFRAIVYNKGAVVLHMLRRLVGDDAFFRGLRRFYAASKFTKVGTEDLRTAMETESGRSLERFFERWIYGSTLPHLRFSYRIEAAQDQAGAAGKQEVALHFEQTGELFDLPVTVTLQYANRKPVNVVVPVTEQVVDWRVPLDGTLRNADVSRDDGTLADVTKY